MQCVEPFRQALSDLLSDRSGDPIACLVSDAMMYFTSDVAGSLNLPRIVLRTGGVASFLTFAAFPVLIDKGYLPAQGVFPFPLFQYLILSLGSKMYRVVVYQLNGFI